MNTIERFLKEEIADKYEAILRYDHKTNSIIVEIRDGLWRRRDSIAIEYINGMESKSFENYLITTMRYLVNKIEEGKKRQEESFEKEKKRYLRHI